MKLRANKSRIRVMCWHEYLKTSLSICFYIMLFINLCANYEQLREFPSFLDPADKDSRGRRIHEDN